MDNPQAWNRYSYVLGNPLLYSDPSGHGQCRTHEECDDLGTTPLGGESGGNSGNSGGGGGDDDGQCNNDPDCKLGQEDDFGLDFTGYLASVITFRSQTWRMWMQRYSGGIGAYIALFLMECPNCAWDIKLKMGMISQGVGLCIDQNTCSYYDYSTPGNIQFGYLVGRLGINKTFADIAGGLINTIDVYVRKVPDATYGGCLWCDDPRDQAAVDFGYNLGINPAYANGITRQQLVSELGNSPFTVGFQPPPSSWVPFSPAQPGPTIFGPSSFDN